MAALIATPDLHVLSLSPELFFRRDGQHMSARPMKGTAPRGRTPREDARLKTWLAMDEKQRAENLMIVDLLRNDLGRVSRIGSVEVTDLFTVETYRSVHQMTSGITAELRSDMGLTRHAAGAVPVRLGHRRAEGARHGDHPRARGRGTAASIPAPSAISRRRATPSSTSPSAPWCSTRPAARWASAAASSPTPRRSSEYEECLLKAHFLTKIDAPFELIETLRYEKGEGFHLLERHLARLQASAHHFGYPFSREAVIAALEAQAAAIAAPVALVRLLLAEDGAITVTSTEITLPTKDTVWRFVISDQRVDEKDPLFYHKTTRRQFYDKEMERQKALTGCDEVVFLNQRGELTEGTRTTLFLEQDGRLFTPALACGLLPGTLREELLDLPRAAASEAVLTPADLARADRLYLGNSVRGLIRAELMQPAEADACAPAHAG